MMKVVEVQFIKDTQGVMTGNEFYPAGARAHFYEAQANVLAERERVVLVGPERFEAETKLTPAPEPAPEPEKPEPNVNYSEMKVKELRALAQDAEIDGASKMKKADLIDALEQKL